MSRNTPISHDEHTTLIFRRRITRTATNGKFNRRQK